MSIKKIVTDIKIKNEPIFFVELKNALGTKVRILNYGAIIKDFIVKNKNGKFQDIVLGFDDVSGYLSEDYLKNYCYFGAIIGRYANRIANSSFIIADEKVNINANIENATLHGGMEGFDKKIWELTPLLSENQNFATFTYLSKDQEEGFPGNLKVSLTFILTEENALELNYSAVTDVSTAINLTHHSYFNLSEKKEGIHQHQHKMHADWVLEQDAHYCVTGKQIPVAGTNHDFRKAKNFSFDWNEDMGYDQSYVLNKSYKSFGMATETFEKKSGLCLDVYTDQPIAHVYTAKFLNVANGKKGVSYGAFDAFCVETQHHPNAVNIADFPSTILHPNECYTQKTVYKVKILQS